MIFVYSAGPLPTALNILQEKNTSLKLEQMFCFLIYNNELIPPF